MTQKENCRFRKRIVRLSDGRELIYYDFGPEQPKLQSGSEESRTPREGDPREG